MYPLHRPRSHRRAQPLVAPRAVLTAKARRVGTIVRVVTIVAVPGAGIIVQDTSTRHAWVPLITVSGLRIQRISGCIKSARGVNTTKK
jgi:hypothetical protein